MKHFCCITLFTLFSFVASAQHEAQLIEWFHEPFTPEKAAILLGKDYEHKRSSEYTRKGSYNCKVQTYRDDGQEYIREFFASGSSLLESPFETKNILLGIKAEEKMEKCKEILEQSDWVIDLEEKSDLNGKFYNFKLQEPGTSRHVYVSLRFRPIKNKWKAVSIYLRKYQKRS